MINLGNRRTANEILRQGEEATYGNALDLFLAWNLQNGFPGYWCLGGLGKCTMVMLGKGPRSGHVKVTLCL